MSHDRKGVNKLALHFWQKEAIWFRRPNIWTSFLLGFWYLKDNTVIITLFNNFFSSPINDNLTFQSHAENWKILLKRENKTNPCLSDYFITNIKKNHTHKQFLDPSRLQATSNIPPLQYKIFTSQWFVKHKTTSTGHTVKIKLSFLVKVC